MDLGVRKRQTAHWTPLCCSETIALAWCVQVGEEGPETASHVEGAFPGGGGPGMECRAVEEKARQERAMVLRGTSRILEHGQHRK